MRQNEILFMRDADLVRRKFFREIGDHFHFFGAGIARNAADGLQRDRDDPITGRLMRRHILRGEAGKRGIGCFSLFESKGRCRARGQGRRGEIGADAIDFRLRQGQRATAMIGKLGLDLGANNVGAFLVHQDFYARLVFVIAPPFEIIDAKNGIGVGEEIGFRQEVADLMRDHGRAAEAAADKDGKAHLAASRSCTI